MICYLDRTFCNSDCINSNCPRFFSKEEEEKAKAWTQSFTQDIDMLVAFSDFSGSCAAYIGSPPEQKD